MHQLHWVVSLIPDVLLNWIYIVIITAGISGVVAGWLGKWIPFYGEYAKFLKPAGVILIALGLYLKGGYDTEMAWRDKVREAEEQVKIAEEKSKKANDDLEKALKDKKIKTKEVQIVIQERIRQVEKRIDAECKVDREAIEILNDAAKNQGGKKK